MVYLTHICLLYEEFILQQPLYGAEKYEQKDKIRQSIGYEMDRWWITSQAAFVDGGFVDSEESGEVWLLLCVLVVSGAAEPV